MQSKWHISFWVLRKKLPKRHRNYFSKNPFKMTYSLNLIFCPKQLKKKQSSKLFEHFSFNISLWFPLYSLWVKNHSHNSILKMFRNCFWLPFFLWQKKLVALFPHFGRSADFCKKNERIFDGIVRKQEEEGGRGVVATRRDAGGISRDGEGKQAS